MKRILLDIAYDGTNYCGWQYQPNGLTLEEVINRELCALLKEDVHVIGGSRTDSGVHAWHNMAVFDTNSRIPAEKICFALNQKLPADITIQASREVPSDWHPRKKNSIKTYEYRIMNRRVPFPARRLDTFFMYHPLNINAMREAASYLVGEHDFKSFCSTSTQAEETIRNVLSIDILPEPCTADNGLAEACTGGSWSSDPTSGQIITIRISGNGFLTHMVRIIAGTLMKVGTGQYTPEKVKAILDEHDRQISGPKAPPQGLTLISYDEVFGLEPSETITSDDWEYTITREGEYPLPGEHTPYGPYTARIDISRSTDEYLERNIRRLVKHAFQDRASEVIVSFPSPADSILPAPDETGSITLGEYILTPLHGSSTGSASSNCSFVVTDTYRQSLNNSDTSNEDGEE